jgi:hypothetical protein
MQEWVLKPETRDTWETTIITKKTADYDFGYCERIFKSLRYVDDLYVFLLNVYPYKEEQKLPPFYRTPDLKEKPPYRKSYVSRIMLKSPLEIAWNTSPLWIALIVFLANYKRMREGVSLLSNDMLYAIRFVHGITDMQIEALKLWINEIAYAVKEHLEKDKSAKRKIKIVSNNIKSGEIEIIIRIKPN